MKIGQRLIAGYLAAAFLVAAIGYLGIIMTSTAKEGFSMATNHTIPKIKALEVLKFAGLRIVSSTSEFGFIRAEKEVIGQKIAQTEKEEEQLIEQGIKLYSDALKEYEDLLKRFSSEDGGLLQDNRKKGLRLQQSSKELVGLKSQGVSGLEVLEKKEVFERNENAFLAALDVAISSEEHEFLRKKAELEFSMESHRNLGIAATIISVIAAIIVGTFISRSVSTPIKKLKDATVDISKGNLGVRIDIDAKDEIGVLATSFNQMTQVLQESRDDLIKAKDFVANILHSMAETLIVVDTETRIKAVNEALLNLVGYTEDELIEQPLKKILADEEFPLKKTNLEVIIDKVGIEGYETHYKAKDGRKVPVLFNSSVILDQNGNVVNLVCTAMDIVKRKRLENSLQESQRRLRTLSASLQAAQEGERKSLSRELHDDLGQLLTVILFDIAQLRKPEIVFTSGTKGILERIQDGTEKALQRVRSLSAILRPGVLDQLGLKAAVISFLEEIQEQTGLKIVEQMQVDHSNIPESVSIAIYRILQEAMTNIVKHAAAKQVIVELRSNHKTVALSITDDGQGFNPKSSTMDNGLGLLGMKERVEWLGGVWWVESAPGQGTTIYVEIPLSPEQLAI
ncbi:MAG: PAS domain S-box protein [Desulfobacterales bacterium]|nr:PAS domain S-box protein [Desulfobacterales bacterium]